MFFKCLAAQLYDAFLIVGLFFVFTAVCLLFEAEAIPVGTHWYQLSLALIALAYYIFSVGKGGQTLGMRAWHLRLISTQGIGPTYGQAAGRIALILPSLLIGVSTAQNPRRLLAQWTKTSLTTCRVAHAKR